MTGLEGLGYFRFPCTHPLSVAGFLAFLCLFPLGSGFILEAYSLPDYPTFLTFLALIPASGKRRSLCISAFCGGFNACFTVV